MNICHRKGKPARAVGTGNGGLAQDGGRDVTSSRPQYSMRSECAQIPPPHLTDAEARLWASAEAARHRGDPTTAWELRRQVLLAQERRCSHG